MEARIFKEVKKHLDVQHFPHDVTFLIGAPGAGKGQNAQLILKEMGYEAPVLTVSALLTTPEAKALIDQGKMVGDEEVTELLLDELKKKIYRRGVLIDGFPRTPAQAEFMLGIINILRGKENDSVKRRGRMIFLEVSETTSVERQLKRGRLAKKHNDLVRKDGQGALSEERVTDYNVEKAAYRYKTYLKTTLKAIEALHGRLKIIHINAEGDIPEVEKELQIKLKDFKLQET